jgi:hypothetical protein
MSNARTHRRRLRRSHLGEAKVYASGTPREVWNRCQHCGTSGLDLMDTHAEFADRAQMHGMATVAPDAITARSIYCYWLCHACGEGGAVLRT